MGEEFYAQLEKCIIEDAKASAIDLCTENESFIKENSFEALETVMKHICDETEDEYPARVQLAQGLLLQITQICNPEDVLLCLYKEIDDTDDDTKFMHLLPSLTHALIKTPDERFKYAIWCFNAIQTFVSKMPAPESLNLEQSEKQMQSQDEIDYDEHRILTIYKKIIELYEAVLPTFVKIENNLVVTKYILKLLGKPFCYLSLNPKTRGFSLAERLIQLVTANCDPFKYLTWLNYHPAHDDDTEVHRLALASYFYLILSTKINYEKIPKVYDNIFVFRHILYYLTELYSHDHQFVIEKGLSLAEIIFIHENWLPHELLDDEIHSKFTQKLSNVIIYSPMKENRQKALETFKKYLLGFDQRGKYLLIHNAYKLVNHSGLMGYLITLYKDEIYNEFKRFQSDSESPFGIYFKGNKLATLLMQFCHLHKKEASDMLELADQIIPALNLLRFLILIDKQDITGIKKLLPEIQTVFIEPLKKGLIISKDNYQVQIKMLEDEAANGDKTEKSQVSVVIGGQTLPNMSMREKMEVLHSSMTAFDVMESLLARLGECIESLG